MAEWTVVSSLATLQAHYGSLEKIADGKISTTLRRWRLIRLDGARLKNGRKHREHQRRFKKEGRESDVELPKVTGEFSSLQPSKVEMIRLLALRLKNGRKHREHQRRFKKEGRESDGIATKSLGNLSTTLQGGDDSLVARVSKMDANIKLHQRRFKKEAKSALRQKGKEPQGKRF